MNLAKTWAFRFLMMVLFLAGCSLHKEIIPLHDEVLTYNLPYDLAYLRSVEALESMEGWDLEMTEKEKGLIQVRNVQFLTLTDSDKRVARILLKRKDRFQTIVKLAPESQRVVGGGDLMQKIGEVLSREI